MNTTVDSFKLDLPISINQVFESFSVDLGQAKELPVQGFSSLRDTKEGYLCFCDRWYKNNPRLADGAIVLCHSSIVEELQRCYPGAFVIASLDPRSLFVDIVNPLAANGQIEVNATIPRPFGISRHASIASNASIHPETLIEAGVTIGNNCVIHRGTWIQAGTVIRDNTVIGVDGITLHKAVEGGMRKLPHLAGVIIGPSTEIGANCSICKGILNDTLIGENVTIGNLCNIGHVASIGRNVWMSVGCLIGGHAHIGNEATIGMGVLIKDNITIGERTQVGMGSVVARAVSSNLSVYGNPARIVPPIQAGPNR